MNNGGVGVRVMRRLDQARRSYELVMRWWRNGSLRSDDIQGDCCPVVGLR